MHCPKLTWIKISRGEAHCVFFKVSWVGDLKVQTGWKHSVKHSWFPVSSVQVKVRNLYQYISSLHMKLQPGLPAEARLLLTNCIHDTVYFHRASTLDLSHWTPCPTWPISFSSNCGNHQKLAEWLVFEKESSLIQERKLDSKFHG
jgi:hypothetical protein